jgi:membrane protease YdiL (CAAX protease family)
LNDNRRLILWLVGGSFVLEVAIAELWLRFQRDAGVLDLLSDPANLLPSIVAGSLLGISLALASRVLFSALTPDLIREMFLPLFRGIGYREVLAISIFPGLGEELLFRGAMQPAIGIVLTSLIFGFVHSGFSRRLLPYGLWSGLVGAALGLLYIATGNLWGSIVAHALVNAMGGLWLRRLE